MKQYQIRKHQAGMTLTESLLVLAIGALIAVLAYGGYKMATADVKSQSQATGVMQLAAKIKQLYASASDYTGLGAAAVFNAKIVPSDFKATSSSVGNAWGGSVALAASGTGFTMTIDKIPTEGCVEFLSGIAGAGSTLQAKSGSGSYSDIKTATTSFSTSTATTTCASGDVTAQLTVQ